MPDPCVPKSDFAAFYRRTLAPLRRYLQILTGNRIDAQDLAHDAYARVYPRMQERGIEQPQAFLYTTARHLAIDRMKRLGRSPLVEADRSPADTSPSPCPAVEKVVMAREEWELLQRRIATLPPGCRHVLHLRMVENLSHAEIALQLRLARSSVEKHLMRAVRLLSEGMRAPRSEAGETVHSLKSKTGSTRI